jgi:hypothetical protein
MASKGYGGAKGYGGVDSANAATAAREEEIRGLFDEIVKYYSPGGAFGQGTEAMLDRQETQYLGQATQGLISAGLFGSTMTAGIPKKFQEEIGIPTRAKLEDIRGQAYAGALGQKAGFIERIKDESPSYETLANLSAQAASAPKPSLSDWLYGEFQGGSTPNPTRTSSSSGTTTGGGQSTAATPASYTSPRIEMGEMLPGASDPEWARDVRKQNKLYLGS